MAFTSATGLIATLVGMSISGIDSGAMHPHMPDVVSYTPIFYVRVATRRSETSTLNYSQGLKQGAFEAVILVGEMNLDTQANNIANANALEDAAVTALEANAAALGLDSYEITPEEDTLGGDTPYWALVIRGEVSG